MGILLIKYEVGLLLVFLINLDDYLLVSLRVFVHFIHLNPPIP
jgi:hypothetical protein